MKAIPVHAHREAAANVATASHPDPGPFSLSRLYVRTVRRGKQCGKTERAPLL